MIDTFDGWIGAIATLALEGDCNQIIGLALDQQEATAMQNCFSNAFGITTISVKERTYIVIRACKKLNLAKLRLARSMLFGIHYGRTNP